MTIQTHEATLQYLRLESTGRRSGTPHQVLLRFVTIGNRIIVFPQNAKNQDWISNLKINPSCRVYTESAIFSCRALIRNINSNDDIFLKVFARKYGMQIVRERYLGQKSYVELQPTGREDGSVDKIVYDDLEAAFDGVAETYDRHIFGNPINTWLRHVSVATLRQHFAPGSVILEIGCGTGTETLSLARNGVTVLACDISRKMLRVLERKAANQNLRDRVVALHCRVDELKTKIQSLGFSRIDGAYSTYGAINTEPRLGDLFHDLHELLKPNGTLILGVWNKYCLYEIVGYLLRAKPRLAFARLRNPVPIGKSRFCVKTNAYSISSLNHLIGPFFNLQSIFGVVILLPPSNLTRYLPGGKSVSLFKTLDLRVGRVFPFNRLGDHFLAVYTSKVRGRS